jgi:omega-6 fatty acid desaturase (delta-12 desaturase)
MERRLAAILAAEVVGYSHLMGEDSAWPFSLEHRGERTRWARHDGWDPTSAVLQSSTYPCLPAVLQWFTGNIGFRHVHHLNPRVPNYQLRERHDWIATLCDVPILSCWEGLRAFRFALCAEDRDRTVTFREPARRATP